MFAWTGKTQHVWLSNPALQARLHKGAHEAFLWIINPTRRSEEATVRVGPQHGRLVADTVLWGDPRTIESARVSVPARDALVVRLRRSKRGEERQALRLIPRISEPSRPKRLGSVRLDRMWVDPVEFALARTGDS